MQLCHVLHIIEVVIIVIIRVELKDTLENFILKLLRLQGKMKNEEQSKPRDSFPRRKENTKPSSDPTSTILDYGKIIYKKIDSKVKRDFSLNNKCKTINSIMSLFWQLYNGKNADLTLRGNVVDKNKYEF